MNEYADTWQPGTCSVEAMLAYKVLEAEGVIQILCVEVGRHTERMRVRYVSDRPHEQVLGLLREAKRALTEKGKSASACGFESERGKAVTG